MDLKGLLLKFIFFSLIVLSVHQCVFGQPEIIFSHLTVEDGLSNNSVNCIEQDSKGFIWLGTRDGLNRYDGVRIKVYKYFYKNNAIDPNIRIYQLKEDDKNNLWIGTNKGLFSYNLEENSFSSFFHSASDAKSLSCNFIRVIFRDTKNNIWIGTESGLNKAIRVKGGFEFEHVPLIEKEDKGWFINIQSIVETSNGNLLIGTTKGLFVIKNSGGKLDSHGAKAAILDDIKVFTIAEDFKHNIWAGSDETGLYKIDSSLTHVERFSHTTNSANGLLHDNIRKILIDKSGQIWIGTLKGLNILRPFSVKFESHTHFPESPSSINSNSIYSIFQDRQGSMWLGTYFGGVNIAEAITPKFKAYQNKLSAHSISSNIISSIVGGSGKNIWVGTEAEGLNLFNPVTQKFMRYKNAENAPASLSANLVKTIVKDSKNHIWVGTYSGGLNLLKGSRFTHFKKADGLQSNNITALLEDELGRLWVGHQDYGINVITGNRRIEKFETLFPGLKLTDSAITCFFQDSKYNIWIGTRTGLNMMQYNVQDSLRSVFSNFPKPVNGEYINCFAEDQRGIWIGSYSGLTCYNIQTKSFENYTYKIGLPAGNVMGIVIDANKNLWLSTNNGIIRVEAGLTYFTIYNSQDGLPGKAFNFNSAYKDNNENIFFGSFNGLVEFSPAEININTMLPSIVLTGLQVNGKLMQPDDSLKIITKNISVTHELELLYNQNNVTIEYAVMNFIKPAKNQSAYKLEGYDHDWVYSDKHLANFTNISPGKYSLWIKGSNNDGLWSKPERVLQITILPPYWKTWWAYTLYVLAILLTISGIVYFLNSRTTLKRNLEYEHAINVKQRELQKMKTDFFTHISHEIRTPLTLILGPAEMLMDNEDAKPSDKKLLNAIKSNADRMLKLTNDLMDFIKADSGYTKLKISENNMVASSRSVFDKFSIAANKKSIKYNFYCTENCILLYYDPYHIEIVLYNLLSNAIKFTPPGGTISMQVKSKGGIVEISVCDTGIGIPKESADKIFTQFFQVDAKGNKKAGSGIGLALSKSLVELHGGTIAFTSVNTPENKTCFFVYLNEGKPSLTEG